jgi:hypothetical protein
MKIAKFDLVITVITILFMLLGSASLGYTMGKNEPCSQVEGIDIRPLK